MAMSTTLDGVESAAADSTPLKAADFGGSGIDFDRVTVAYGGLVVLSELSLSINPGEIVAIIGPSGSGKTTALRAVAGFVRPTSGRVRIGPRDVTDLAPYDRDIGMVVQNYALFPHMRVEENVAFGLRARRAPAAMIQERVAECLRMVGMANYAKRFPRELSGGQQQRVAIARALAIHPQVLLLDEPLSALDAQIRRNMLDELARLHQALPHLTVLYVTHDQTEALTLADRIAIMRDGKLVSYGASQMLYQRPPNRFTAEFLGRANLLEVTVESENRDGFVRVRCGDDDLVALHHPELGVGSRCLLCIRPHEISLGAAEGTANTLHGTVQSTVWQGDQHHVAAEAAGRLVRLVCAPMLEPPGLGSPLSMHFQPQHAVLIPGEADLG
ncbi:MAG TPA: ABC transporter ATP-binding protein [Dongiaceae bacterium]